jgi:TRAP-type C4-dicarboxylate transport system substrate-binding protein
MKMKRLIASLALLGLIAAPAVAATTKAAMSQSSAKPAKAQHKIAKKSAKAAVNARTPG